MMNIPLTLITWRIGKSAIDTLESILIYESRCREVLGTLKKEFGSVFYLATCQRIVVVSSIKHEKIAIQFRDRFLELTHQTKEIDDYGEMFIGCKAFRHLAELISSLDSIVIGEDQIQYQFKQAYNRNEQYLDKNLKHLLQQVIRIGKRLRSRTLLGNGKTSMMSLITKIFGEQLKKANSIGIIGTGKMAMGVIKVASQSNPSISIYSRKPERTNIDLKGYKTENFSNMGTHDIIFTATTVSMPLITKKVINRLGTSPLTIFDLGIPRNCDEDIKNLVNVELIGIEDLLKLSREVNLHTDYTNIHRVLDEEINSSLDTHVSKQKAPYYVSLRKELSRIAAKYKDDFVKSDLQSEKNYQQMINRLIHISQKHLENVLLENEVEN